MSAWSNLKLKKGKDHTFSRLVKKLKEAHAKEEEKKKKERKSDE